MKGLINIKNNDLKCFMWCHIRLINPTNNHPERINKQDKKKHNYELNENRFNLNVNDFWYENKFYPLYISKKSNTQVLNVLLITNEKKSNYVFIKDFDKLMYSKAKTKTEHKNYFCMACLQNFIIEKILNNHKKSCLFLNGCQ